MPGKYSFIDTETDQLLRLSVGVLPGIEKSIAVFDVEGELTIKTIDHASGSISEMLPSDDPAYYLRIKQLREKKNPYEWLGRDEVPFEEEQIEETDGKTKKTDIFNELEKHILLIRLSGSNKKMPGLFLLYFKPNLSNFGLSRLDRELSTQNKGIVGHLIYNFFIAKKAEDTKNQQIFKGINNNIKSLIRRSSNLEKEFIKLQHQHCLGLISLAKQFLRIHSLRDRVDYTLTDEAAEKLSSFEGEIKALEKIIDNAVIFVNNLYFDENEPEVLINDWCINLDDHHLTADSDNAQIRIDSRESRAMLLLDKIEKAAKIVLAKKMPLTSLAVGQACPKPITAPAISDAFKKNGVKIRELLNKYPEKWMIIRKQFRPLRNIIDGPNKLDREVSG